MSFTDKVVAITGGASGIGLALAKILAAKGASLSIADISKDNIDATAKFFDQAATPCLITAVDVTKSKEVDDWIAATVKHFGKLNYAANCAGIGSPRGRFIVDMDDNDWHQVQDVNLSGVFFSVRAELRVMQDHGAIVNISSIAGLKGFPTQVSYCASKHGVCGITKTAAREVSDRNIRVNAVCPGYIDTPLTRDAGNEKEAAETAAQLQQIMQMAALKRAGQAEEVGKFMAYLLSDDASFITGTIHPVCGGIMA